MSIVTGVVEGISRKYDKFSVLLDNGTWYGTKQEWAPSPEPQKGDTISFDNGGKKYLSKVKITSAGGGSPAPSGGGKKAWSNIGVELGHASNIAKDMALEATRTGAVGPVGSDEYYRFWVKHTEKVHSVMSVLRKRHEDGETTKPVDEEVVVVEKGEVSKPEPTPEMSVEEDLFS